MSARDPGHGEVLNDAIEAALDAVYISLPARVVAYDAVTQTADVQPIPKVRHLDEDGAVVIGPLPVLPGRPVIFPGGGGFTVTFPITVGDTVLVQFSAASLDKWVASQAEGPLDPESHARHSLADAVVIPGLRNRANARANPPSSTIVIGKEGEVRHPAALGDAVASYLSSVKSWADTVRTEINTLAGSPVILPLASPPDVTSSTVEVTE